MKTPNVETVLEILIFRSQCSTSAHDWKNSGNDILIIPIPLRREQKTWRKQWLWLRISLFYDSSIRARDNAAYKTRVCDSIPIYSECC